MCCLLQNLAVLQQAICGECGLVDSCNKRFHHPSSRLHVSTDSNCFYYNSRCIAASPDDKHIIKQTRLDFSAYAVQTKEQQEPEAVDGLMSGGYGKKVSVNAHRMHSVVVPQHKQLRHANSCNAQSGAYFLSA